ncbi:MAG: AAA family ATPase [Acidobacteriota bacterium]|nr:AAA family ATPase [Acidobacteriota bacterium]
MTVSIAGYRIIEQIYENRNSLIFRANRIEDCKPVIIKKLKEDFPSPDELTRYRQEYEITRDLDSPGIIHTYGLEKVNNKLMIILEDFGAFSLKMLWPDQALPLLAFFPIALQTVDALGKVHENRVIHKDINPGNLVYNPKTGELKIIDFGIATRLRRVTQYLDNPKNLEGTLAYMSPEQTGRMNRAVDYRTDFYSLGATLYHLLCGKPPFEEDDPMAMVHCHIARYPKPPHQVNPEIPEMLSEVIMRLLAKHAEHRYQSAWGLSEDLNRCYTEWQEEGVISKFQPGVQDFSPHFELSQKIYGREKEMKALNEAFERTMEGTTVLVRLGGYSGIGKSALVQELFKPLTRCGGFFISGKFDQYRHGTPCSAILDALEELAGQLMSASEKELTHWKHAIMKAVRSNGRIITDAVPAMEKIIGPQPPLEDVDASSRRNRLLRTLSCFIRSFCRPGRPLILFVDDLQWADDQSLDLLEWLALNDTETPMLIIGAYRDNEVNEMHPLTRTWQRIIKEPILRLKIDVQPLTPEDVGRFIADSLRLDMEDVGTLRNLVYAKTGGNPFFMNRFLESLHEDGLLVLERVEGRSRWNWDEDAIHARDFSDNLVDLMVERLCRHQEETRNALKLAACLGNRFDLDTLAVIRGMRPGKTFEALLPAVQDGLILPLSHLETREEEETTLVIAHFKFCHDRVQQAAWQLNDPEELPGIQYEIGNLLLDNFSEEHLHQQYLKVVDLLNQGRPLITNPEELARLADLNYQAGRRAMDGAAHGMAREYFALAMDCLDDDIWEKGYERALDLHHQRARAEAASGHPDEAKYFLNLALARTDKPVERAVLYKEISGIYQSQHQHAEAMEQVAMGLRLLGIDIPEKPESFLPLLYEQIDHLLEETQPESLPPMTNPLGKVALQFTETIIWSGYMVDWSVFCFLLAKQVILTLQHGHTSESIIAVSSYSGVLKVLERYEASVEVGIWSEKLRKLNHYPMTGPNPGYALSCYNELTESQWLHFHDCLDSGRLFSAATSLFAMAVDEYILGRQPDENNILALGLEFTKKSRATVAETVLKGMQYIWWNLNGPTPAQVFGSPEEVGHLATLKGYTRCLYLMMKGEVLLIYGRRSEALVCSREAEKLSRHIQGTGYADYHQWIHAVISSINFASLPKDQQRSVKTYLQDTIKKLARLEAINTSAFGYQYHLVQAELLRIESRPLECLDAYKKAVKSAHDHEHIRHEALIHERIVQFWEGFSHEEYTRGHLRQAWQCYRVLDMEPKTLELETRLGRLTGRPARDLDATGNTATNARDGKGLDLHTVIKAGQAISGKLNLSELLPSMMSIVIENAGAEKGSLILMEGGHWVVKARGNAHDVKFLDKGIPLFSCDDIAVGAVQYVAKSNEPLMLDDAGKEGVLTRDPHIRSKGIRSLLCLPIPARSRGRCLLYLENNITSGAFRKQHLEVLQTLTTQMAISFENALLYTDLAHTNQTLEEKVVERTRELRAKNNELADKNQEIVMAQQQLVVKEKMASLGVLTAGVAHEINNPTNFAYGGAQNLERQLDEFRRFILSLAEDAPDEVQDTMKQRMSPLFEQCRIILEGTSRINQIVRDLRLFTRKDEAPQKRADINKAMSSTINLIRANFHDRIQFLTDFQDQVIMDCWPAELNQVFMNLIVNACDAIDARFGTSPGKEHGRIIITIRILVNHAVISVEDNGTGMSPEVRKKIFEPFFTTKDVGSGTGLGLSISYGIIKKHNGQIEVTSNPDEGSVFTIHLPMNPL